MEESEDSDTNSPYKQMSNDNCFSHTAVWNNTEFPGPLHSVCDELGEEEWKTKDGKIVFFRQQKQIQIEKAQNFA